MTDVFGSVNDSNVVRVLAEHHNKLLEVPAGKYQTLVKVR